MKKLFLLSMLIIASAGIYGQALNCEKFKNGKFKIVGNGKTYILERHGSYQLEYHEGATDSTTFKVNWVNSCAYTLTPTAETLKKYPGIPKNAILTITIVKTSANSYTQRSTANFTDKATTSEVFKID